MTKFAPAPVAAIKTDLGRLIGPDSVLTDPDITASFGRDASGRYGIDVPPLVLRPRSAHHVAVALAWCNERNVAVVPQGGNTGLVWNSVPRHEGQVILSSAALTSVHSSPGLLRVGAGVTQGQLHELAAAQGMAYGIRIVPNSTAGGNAACNAKGSRAYRNGDTARHVQGLEAAFVDGSIDDNFQQRPGPDWLRLMIGSEGTLGIITEVALSLIPDHPERAVALLGLPSMTAVVQAIDLLKAEPFVEALEVMMGESLEFVRQVMKLPVPPCGSAPAHLLVEATGRSDPTEPLIQALSALPGDLILGSSFAETPAQRTALWAYRHAFPEACNKYAPIKLDVAVPLEHYASFMDKLAGVITNICRDARVVLFGHGALGSVHVNVLNVAHTDAVTQAVFSLVSQHGGTIAAEHGVGHLKAKWLHLCRSATEIQHLKAIKAALDPNSVLNPGVIFA